MMKFTTLVVGATGATGRLVVQQLLHLGQSVRVIVRSKERMLEAITDTPNCDKRLSIVEASLLDLSDDELKHEIEQVDAVVCCLGHNLTFRGIWGQPRRLVKDSVERLTKALVATNPTSTMASTTSKKFILMNSDGVSHPGGTDDPRSTIEQIILFLIRYLLPPHPDNEEAAAFLHKNIGYTGTLQWVVIRPMDLIDGSVSDYKLMDKPPAGGIFGSGVATRANVAKCMVDMLTDDDLFAKYRMTMPVLHDEKQSEDFDSKKDL